MLVAHQYGPGFVGIYDFGDGNGIDGDPTLAGNQDFKFQFDLQPTAAYITSVQAARTDTASDGTQTTSTYGPRSYFELPLLRDHSRADAPPTSFYIDFSTPLPTNIDYTNARSRTDPHRQRHQLSVRR